MFTHCFFFIIFGSNGTSVSRSDIVWMTHFHCFDSFRPAARMDFAYEIWTQTIRFTRPRSAHTHFSRQTILCHSARLRWVVAPSNWIVFVFSLSLILSALHLNRKYTRKPIQNEVINSDWDLWHGFSTRMDSWCNVHSMCADGRRTSLWFVLEHILAFVPSFFFKTTRNCIGNDNENYWFHVRYSTKWPREKMSFLIVFWASWWFRTRLKIESIDMKAEWMII